MGEYRKELRSHILGYFPKELRVELELLCRQRTVGKGEAIRNLIAKYKLPNDLSSLGMGTNRYALKMHGYVIKFATDHDGKIDNLKEFKMSERLYPYVTKTYEVSSNGTILVAEYVQPFLTFSEMCRYAEQIRDILQKISTQYLIGDIGLIEKNCTNWGLRIGTEEPVCLDYAYVYDIHSDLFICRKCKTQTMLVPTRDYDELVCPTCKHKTTFEEIRGMIGNNVHDHEIGDLTEEGYLLRGEYETHDLDPTRSKYIIELIKQKQEETEMTNRGKAVRDAMLRLSNDFMGEADTFRQPKKKKADDDELVVVATSPIVDQADVFVDEDEEDYEYAEDVDDVEENEEEPDDDDIEYEEDDAEEDDAEEDDDGVAFTASIADVVKPKQAPVDVLATKLDDIKEAINEQNKKIIKDVFPEAVTAKPADPKKDLPTVEAVEVKPVPSEATPAMPKGAKIVGKVVSTKPETDSTFDPNFIRNASKAASKFSNKLGEYFQAADIYNSDGSKIDVWIQMQGHINKSHKGRRIRNREELLNAVQSTLYRTLIEFCGFVEAEVPQGSSRLWTLDPKDIPAGHEPTVRTIQTYWNERAINSLEGSELVEKLSELGLGLQAGLRHMFVDRLVLKNGFDKVGAERITGWYINPLIIDEDESDEPDEEANAEPQVEAEAVIPAEVFPEEEVEEVQSEEVQPEPVQEEEPTLVEEPEHANDTWESEEFARESSSEIDDSLSAYMTDVLGVDPDDFVVGDDGTAPLTVTVREDGIMGTKITVATFDDDGLVMIPLYVNTGIIPAQAPPAQASERNGAWEWLVHFFPDDAEIIDDPNFVPGIVKDRRMDRKDVSVRVILDERTDGSLLVGTYRVLITNDVFADDQVLQTINNIICREIGSSAVSSLATYVSAFYEDDDDDDEDGINDVEENDETEASSAAVDMMSHYVDDDDEEEHLRFQQIRRKKNRNNYDD